MKYRPDIDGLRAVAVLAVLLFHANMGVSGGYVGVDVFFVISGYLISGLILGELDRGQFHIVAFWDRRIRRILPAMVLVIVSCLIAGGFLMIPRHFKELGQSVVAQALLVSNVYFWKQSDYFAPDVTLRPLLHTWSLAVEEQFYLLFPFLLMGLGRLSRGWRSWILLLLCGGSFALCVYCSYRHDIANFYLLPTRAWELLIGAWVMALGTQRPLSRWLAEVCSTLGFAAIAFAGFCFDADTRFPGAAALLPCGGTALLIWANRTRLTSIGKLLSLRPIVFIGLISYSLYLWHWPVLVFGRYVLLSPPSLAVQLFFIMLSVALAVLSWMLVETPFRKRRLLQTRPQAFAFAAVTALVLLLVGFGINRTGGVPNRLSPAALQYAQGAYDRWRTVDLSVEDALRGNFVELGGAGKDQPVQLFVWGDSHGMAAFPVLDAMCRDYSIRGQAGTHVAQAPLIGYESYGRDSMKEECIPFNDAIASYIRTHRIPCVIIIASWQGWVTYGRDAEKLHRSLLATIAAIKDGGSKIWIMKDTPHQPFNVPQALMLASSYWGDPDRMGLSLDAQREVNRLMDPIFEGIDDPNVAFLDPMDLFLSRQGFFRVGAGGYALYYDDHHLSTHGAMVLRPMFEPVFAGIRQTAALSAQSSAK